MAAIVSCQVRFALLHSPFSSSVQNAAMSLTRRLLSHPTESRRIDSISPRYTNYQIYVGAAAVTHSMKRRTKPRTLAPSIKPLHWYNAPSSNNEIEQGNTSRLLQRRRTTISADFGRDVPPESACNEFVSPGDRWYVAHRILTALQARRACFPQVPHS